MHNLTIHRERFYLAMREIQNRAARCFINTTAFHSNRAVFHDVDAPDPMLAAEFVQRFHHAERRQRLSVDCDTIAGFESKIDMFRFVRRVFRRDT